VHAADGRDTGPASISRWIIVGTRNVCVPPSRLTAWATASGLKLRKTIETAGTRRACSGLYFGITATDVDYLAYALREGLVITPVRRVRANRPHGVVCGVWITIPRSWRPRRSNRRGPDGLGDPTRG
jgi:hypothetical protein